MSKNAPATTRKNLVLEEIVETASAVFAEKGFRSATLENVAERLGVSRAALYYYVESKEDLLRRVIGDFITRQAKRLEAVRDRDDLSPEEKLREGIRAQVHLFGEHPDVMRVFLREAAELPEDLYREQVKQRRKVDAAIRGIIRDGVEAGRFREVDPRIGTFAIFGMVNWMHVWYEPDGQLGHDRIADEFADLVLRGLIIEQADDGPRSVEANLQLLRNTVDSLEAEVGHLREGRRQADR